MKTYGNTSGFSIVFAMGIVLSVSLTIVYLLEYIIPFAKNTKGIEFSSNAFYQSSSAIEDALYYVSQNNLGDEIQEPLVTNYNNPSSHPDHPNSHPSSHQEQSDFGYDIIARGDTIPPAGEGNSEYDPDWNKLAPGAPVQLEIGENQWDSAEIHVRIPDIKHTATPTRLQNMTGGIVSWQLSATDTALNAGTGSNRLNEDFLKTNVSKRFDINNTSGKTLEGSDFTFENFYSTYCDGFNERCSLNLSVVNNLILDDPENTPVPYIEYQITGADNIPLRYTRVKAAGYSYGFQKKLDISIPQQTVNEAIIFTVFQ